MDTECATTFAFEAVRVGEAHRFSVSVGIWCWSASSGSLRVVLNVEMKRLHIESTHQGMLSIVVHCCPLLFIVVHCCPLLFIVVHCCQLLSIVVHSCPFLSFLVHSLSFCESILVNCFGAIFELFFGHKVYLKVPTLWFGQNLTQYFAPGTIFFYGKVFWKKKF